MYILSGGVYGGRCLRNKRGGLKQSTLGKSDGSLVSGIPTLLHELGQSLCYLLVPKRIFFLPVWILHLAVERLAVEHRRRCCSKTDILRAASPLARHK